MPFMALCPGVVPVGLASAVAEPNIRSGVEGLTRRFTAPRLRLSPPNLGAHCHRGASLFLLPCRAH